MHHDKEIPTEDGWYLIQCGEDGNFIANLIAGCEPRQMDVFFPEGDHFFRRVPFDETEQGMWVPLYKGASTGPIQQLPWEGPACWTGPLPFPYDAGRSALTDFSQDISKEVQENQTAFVIIHAADRECGPYSEASTVVGFLPRHEARKLAWMISRTQDRGREWTPAAKKASFRVVR